MLLSLKQKTPNTKFGLIISKDNLRRIKSHLSMIFTVPFLTDHRLSLDTYSSFWFNHLEQVSKWAIFLPLSSVILRPRGGWSFRRLWTRERGWTVALLLQTNGFLLQCTWAFEICTSYKIEYFLVSSVFGIIFLMRLFVLITLYESKQHLGSSCKQDDTQEIERCD